MHTCGSVLSCRHMYHNSCCFFTEFLLLHPFPFQEKPLISVAGPESWNFIHELGTPHQLCSITIFICSMSLFIKYHIWIGWPQASNYSPKSPPKTSKTFSHFPVTAASASLFQALPRPPRVVTAALGGRDVVLHALPVPPSLGRGSSMAKVEGFFASWRIENCWNLVGLVFFVELQPRAGRMKEPYKNKVVSNKHSHKHHWPNGWFWVQKGLVGMVHTYGTQHAKCTNIDGSVQLRTYTDWWCNLVEHAMLIFRHLAIIRISVC